MVATESMARPGTEPRAAADEIFRRAEASGLRLALIGRSVALVPVCVWFAVYGSVPWGKSTAAILAVYAIAGIVLRRWADRPRAAVWIRYGVFSVDILTLGAALAFAPLSQSEAVPQHFVFRAYGVHYFLIALGGAALTLSPRLLLWCGTLVAAVWWGIFLYTTRALDETLTWGDLDRMGYQALTLDPAFVGAGNRVEEGAVILGLSALLALAVHRARKTVRQWAESDAGRRRARQLFGHFVPQAVVDRLLAPEGSFGPERREATILYLDIEGFTAMVESRAPEAAIEVLNDFLAAAEDAIACHGGVVTNIQGDAILAVFNVPTDLDVHAARAIEAGQALVAMAEARRFGGTRLGVRVGINTGAVAAGVVGGGARRVYTVHGDAVNTAARLEALNKEMGTRVLVSASAYHAAGAPTGFVSRGEVDIRGLRAPLELYAPA